MQNKLHQGLVAVGFCLLLTACQVKQYSFFQASTTARYQTEQPEAVSEPTAERTEPAATVSQETPAPEPARAAADSGHRVVPVEAVVTTTPKTARQVARMQKQSLRQQLKTMLRQRKAEPPSGGTNGMAVASFITGLLSILLLFAPPISAITLLLGPLALVLGIVSIGQIRRRDERGLGFGIVGIVFGGLYVLLLLLAVAALSAYR